MMTFVLVVVFDTAVVMVAVEAAERKFGVHFVAGFHLVGIVTRGGNQLVYFLLADLLRVVDHLQVFALAIPGCQLDTGLVKRGLDALFAHAAVAINFNGSFGGFCLREQLRGYKRQESKYE